MKIVLETLNICSTNLFTEVDFESGMTCINSSPYAEASTKGVFDFPAGTIGIEFNVADENIRLEFENVSVELGLDGSVNIFKKEEDDEDIKLDRLKKLKTLSDHHSQTISFIMTEDPSFHVHREMGEEVFKIIVVG